MCRARGIWGEKTVPRDTEEQPRTIILTFALHGSVACGQEEGKWHLWFSPCETLDLPQLHASASSVWGWGQQRCARSGGAGHCWGRKQSVCSSLMLIAKRLPLLRAVLWLIFCVCSFLQQISPFGLVSHGRMISWTTLARIKKHPSLPRVFPEHHTRAQLTEASVAEGPMVARGWIHL